MTRQTMEKSLAERLNADAEYRRQLEIPDLDESEFATLDYLRRENSKSINQLQYELRKEQF